MKEILLAIHLEELPEGGFLATSEKRSDEAIRVVGGIILVPTPPRLPRPDSVGTRNDKSIIKRGLPPS